MNNNIGERIYLKLISVDEIDDRVMAWFVDTELMRYYTSSKKSITRETLINSILKGQEEGNVFTYGIYTSDYDKLIGTVKLGTIDKVHSTSDLVVLIGDREYLGKGLAVEAIKLGNQIAFNEFNIRKLFGGMYLSNTASIKAYTKAGWIIEGCLKGFYWVAGKNEDRVLVGCFNPNYFTDVEIMTIKENENRYI